VGECGIARRDRLGLLASLPGRQRRGHRRLIAAMRQRLARGEPVAPMYGLLGLAWLQRQAEAAEQLVRARRGEPARAP
jgi:hypothetical protein